MSGDDRGFDLISQLLLKRPLLRMHGVPGPKLRSLHIDYTITMESFQVMGFIDVIRSLPKLLRLFRRVKEEILHLNPKAVLLIDYPGFTLRLAKSLRKAGYTGKLIQYVCPTVWAWKKNRITLMEESLDGLLTLFPFEPPLFNKEKLNAVYVGHPLIESLESETTSDEWTPPYRGPYLSIFPGSRSTEIQHNLPLQFAVAQETRLPIAVSCSHERFLPLIQKIVGDDAAIVPPRETPHLLKGSHFAIATSGTICLQLALHNVPTVCTYAIRPIDQFIATKIFRINLPHYCIVNILSKKELFPEFFGSNLTFHTLSTAVHKMIEGTHPCDTQTIAEMLGKKKASYEAAAALLPYIEG